jgi:hypothetical protein
MNRKQFEKMIEPYLSLNEKWLFKGGMAVDELNMGVDLDKIKKISGGYLGSNDINFNLNKDYDYLNKKDILYVVSKGKGQFIFIYSLKDKHYFFRNIKYSTITGKFLHPGWNTDVPISVNSTETPPHQYIERGYSISSMNGGKGWGAKSSHNTVYELPLTLSSIFINWQLSNPMDVKL